jgi:hypothetical protein
VQKQTLTKLDENTIKKIGNNLRWVNFDHIAHRKKGEILSHQHLQNPTLGILIAVGQGVRHHAKGCMALMW